MENTKLINLKRLACEFFFKAVNGQDTENNLDNFNKLNKIINNKK